MAGLCWIMYFSVKVLKKDYQTKLEVGYNFVKGDIKWDNQIITSMSIIAIICGSLASLVGLGGGVIYSPLMLEYGVDLKVTSATGMYMVMLGTFATVVQFLMMDVLPMDYSLFLGIIIAV